MTTVANPKIQMEPGQRLYFSDIAGCRDCGRVILVWTGYEVGAKCTCGAFNWQYISPSSYCTVERVADGSFLLHDFAGPTG